MILGKLIWVLSHVTDQWASHPPARLSPRLTPARSPVGWPVVDWPTVGCPVVIMLITVNVPIGPLLHLGKLGLLPAGQAAVGPHLGLGGANPRLLVFQA